MNGQADDRKHAVFTHKGLRRLYEDDSAKGVPAAAIDKLRKMLFALERLRTVEQLRTVAAWKPTR